MKITELVSIVVPCYNHAQYLEECIQSALNQTYPNIEIIIINDGSNDNTKEVALLLQEKYPEKIKVILQENTGVSVARNNAIKQSTGKYILPLDADDLIDKSIITSCLQHMTNHDADIVYVNQQCFGTKNHLIERPPFSKNNLLYQNISGPSGLYKREVWEETGGYAENMKGGYEDWEFWLHAFKKGYKFQLLPEPLHLYRRHEISSITKAIDQNFYLRSKLVMNHLELYPTEHVKRSIEVISDSESLADVYFYAPIDLLKNEKYLTESINQYFTSKKLQEKQFIHIPDSNPRIILYALETIKDKEHLKQLCTNKGNDLVIFYSSLRYEIPMLKNLNFTWDNDKGITETKGSIFPFVFKSVREDDTLQLIAHKYFYRYHTEIFEPKTNKTISICQHRIENREKTINNRDTMIQNREKTIQKKVDIINKQSTTIEKVNKELVRLKRAFKIPCQPHLVT